MSQLFLLITIAALSTIGGDNPVTGSTSRINQGRKSTTIETAVTDPGGARKALSDNAAAQAARDGLTLTAKNTKIEFIGTHVGDKPDPRTGVFKKLSGRIVTDSDRLASIQIEIDTPSLETEIAKLTNHLKTADFFSVRQYPKASFMSTRITTGAEGVATVKGNFTLLGVTKEISFPATFKSADGNASLKSSFKIDRTDYGMDFKPELVETIVTIRVTIDGRR